MLTSNSIHGPKMHYYAIKEIYKQLNWYTKHIHYIGKYLLL